MSLADEARATNEEGRPVLAPGEVMPAGDAGQFWIGSFDTKGKTYLCDLAEYDFNGECDCWGFVRWKKPNLESGLYPGQRFRCRHLKRVWSIFAEYCLRRMMETGGLTAKRRNPVRTYYLKRP